MSLRTPIILTAGCLFVIWLYFTIRQFWTTLQFVSAPPLMTAYNGKSEDIHTSHQISEPNIDIHTTKSPSFAPTNHLHESSTTNDDSDDSNDVPTPQPSEILIQDPYLTEEDEIELTFEFFNDQHLYLYDVPYFADDSIFIMSMVTNSSELALKEQLQTLDEISCIFKDTFYLIFESNSKDDTPQILKNWTSNDNNLKNNNHNEFCKQYLNGFHRERMHDIEQTGDYLNNLFMDNTSKSTHINSIFSDRKTSILNKTVLFGDQYVDENMNRFKDRINSRFLDRIEKYSFYRNMLLQFMKDIIINDLDNFSFDYLMIIDLDIFGYQKRIFLSELYYYHKQKRLSNDGNIILCSHGTLAHGYYMDTFASVDTNNQWYYEYQRNKTYENMTDIYLKGFPKQRLKPMRSCFGGIVIYSNVDTIIESNCNYNVIWSIYDAPKSIQQQVVDKQYPQITYFANQMRDWRPKKKSKTRRYKRRDNHICEHIPFHYCLYYTNNYSAAIAKYAYLFYEPAKMYKLDFNERLIEQTPSPTSESAKQRRRRERREQMEARKREREEKKKQMDIGHRLMLDTNNKKTNNPKKQRKKRMLWILLIVLIIVLLCICGGFALAKVLEIKY